MTPEEFNGMYDAFRFQMKKVKGYLMCPAKIWFKEWEEFRSVKNNQQGVKDN